MEQQATELRRHCIEAFQFADQDCKGYLSQEDYKVAVIALLGYKPSSREVDSLWKRDVGACPGLSEVRFTELMLPRLGSRERAQFIRDVFLAFDRRCQGFLSVSDCRCAFMTAAPHIKEEQVETFFREVDGDMDGRISFRDFELMMQYFTLTSDGNCPSHYHC